MDKKVNPEIDTTRFINVDDADFTFYIGGQPREVKAGETKIMPVYIAQLGAKHLIDRILQQKHGIKDTLRDTPVRNDYMAKILPDLAEIAEVKQSTPEEMLEHVNQELERQSRLLAELTKAPKSDDKDKRIADLEKQVAELITNSKEKKEKKVVTK